MIHKKQKPIQHEMPLLENALHNNGNEDRRTIAMQRFMERLAEACDAMQDDVAEGNGQPASLPSAVSFGDENGWILIAFRLDWIFMLTYIALVTVPVLYLFFNTLTPNTQNQVNEKPIHFL